MWLVLPVLLLGACGSGGRTFQVTVEGDGVDQAEVEVSKSDWGGDDADATVEVVDLPWSTTIEAEGSGFRVKVTNLSNTGTVRCEAVWPDASTGGTWRREGRRSASCGGKVFELDGVLQVDPTGVGLDS